MGRGRVSFFSFFFQCSVNISFRALSFSLIKGGGKLKKRKLLTGISSGSGCGGGSEAITVATAGAVTAGLAAFCLEAAALEAGDGGGSGLCSPAEK